MADVFSIEVDQHNLNEAVRLRMQFPGRTEAEIVNTAAYWIAVNTKQLTPSVPQSRINTELMVKVTPRIGERGKMRGKPLSMKSSRNRILVGGIGTSRKYPSVPLAALIVQASVLRVGMESSQPGLSEYNRRTNMRFARLRSPFAGESRAKGRRNMAAAIHRMIAARRSSTQFLLSGWVRAVQILRPFAVQKFRRGQAPPLEDRKSHHGGPDRGTAVAAVEGSPSVWAMIENSTGMEGSVNAANYNQALIAYGAPALQAAIDIETHLMLEYAARHMDRANWTAFQKCLV